MGRPAKQSGPRARVARFADSMGARRFSDRWKEIRERPIRAGADLSQSVEPEAVCGAEQRLYVRRRRQWEQRAANAEAARLCSNRNRRARESGARRFLRRTLESCQLKLRQRPGGDFLKGLADRRRVGI